MNGHACWLGHAGWRGVLYEPLNNELVCLDPEDLVADDQGRPPRIKEMLERLDVNHLSQFYQLWQRVPELSCRRRRSRNAVAGGAAPGRTSVPAALALGCRGLGVVRFDFVYVCSGCQKLLSF